MPITNNIFFIMLISRYSHMRKLFFLLPFRVIFFTSCQINNHIDGMARVLISSHVSQTSILHDEKNNLAQE